MVYISKLVKMKGMINVKEKSTLLAIGGVVAITIAVIISSSIAKQAVDTELVKQVVSGLVGFAGAGVVAVASSSSTTKSSDK